MIDSGKILVVDDAGEARSELSRILRSVGFSVIEAPSGKIAKKVLKEQAPAMLILGSLPDLEAYELGNQVRRKSALSFIPVLQIANQSVSNLDHVRNLEKPADGFLIYPVDPMVLLATVRSLFRLKQVNDSLRECEANLLLTLNASEMSIWYWDVSSKQLRFSDSLNALLGKASNFDDWNYHTFLDCVNQEDRSAIEDELCKIFSGGVKTFSVEFRAVWSDQSLRWLSTRGELLQNEKGEITGLRGTLIDVQKLKQAELDSQIARLAAESANRAKTQFLANLSHEIRTPISSILGFADLLIENEVSFTRSELGNRIRSNGDQLLRLIDDVLSLSKFEEGKIPLKKEAFPVHEVISEVRRSLLPIAERKGIEILVHYGKKGHPIIYSDRVRFQQIITNLLNNALKFSEKGTVHLRLVHDQGLTIEVEDCGIGMSAEAQQKIFQPFTQADDTISARFGGSGLGLMISKKIANALGGDLTLKWSEALKGSCFQVTLDIGTATDRVLGRARIEERDFHRPNQLEGMRILLVDDSVDNEELIRFYLQKDGARVEVAHNGFEAFDKASTALYDIVLMDVQMPGMDGLEATRRLRASGVKTPIIALSAHAMNEEVDRSIAAGCNSHLAKPVSRRELIDRIRNQTFLN